MTEHNYYTCDYCNKTFKDYEECGAHERQHRLDLLNGKIRLFGMRDGVFIEKTLDADGLDSFTFIYCADKGAWDSFQMILRAEGYNDMENDVQYRNKFFGYDECNSCWYDVIERMNDIETLYSNLVNKVGEKG